MRRGIYKIIKYLLLLRSKRCEQPKEMLMNYCISGMPNQSNMNMQGPPRGPPPNQQMGPGPNNMGQQMPAPHVNPAFFNQNSGMSLKNLNSEPYKC